ncbi:MarR family transcriptional regulator [bacterium]|nr:MarR family transcriptional regulator [bacterium]MBP3846461.1 MarR family transcriptional regulator [bacterium]
MKEIKLNHYVDTIIYSVDMIIRNLKAELKHRIDKLDLGITGEQFVVLDTVSYYENMYPQKLSEILQKDKSNTNRMIKVLVDEGLLTKEVGKNNNRLVYILKVTEKGKKLVDENMPVIKKYLTEIFESISDEEIELLHSMSIKFENALIKNKK